MKRTNNLDLSRLILGHERQIEFLRKQETDRFADRARELLVICQDEGIPIKAIDASDDMFATILPRDVRVNVAWMQKALEEPSFDDVGITFTEKSREAMTELCKLVRYCQEKDTLGDFKIDIGNPGELLGRYSLPTGELITKLPMEAPWMSGMGACLIKILALRKDGDVVMAQLGDEKNQPYPSKSSPDKTAWVKLDDFPNEWPQ